MFAGLAVEDDDDDDDGDSSAAAEEEVPKEEVPKAHSIYGDVDADDLQIAIEVLHQVAADLTLFRSRPFKELREAIGPLARELTGSGEGGQSLSMADVPMDVNSTMDKGHRYDAMPETKDRHE